VNNRNGAAVQPPNPAVEGLASCAIGTTVTDARCLL
jgi:hypothetical protein